MRRLLLGLFSLLLVTPYMLPVQATAASPQGIQVSPYLQEVPFQANESKKS
ncbi:MAG: hypothetical protein JWL85_645, partial [Candidatus Saccharibacteria bacterium]|nr:hypothetical protein [Candidatus Saccharibacteria bacterium]